MRHWHQLLWFWLAASCLSSLAVAGYVERGELPGADGNFTANLAYESRRGLSLRVTQADGAVLDVSLARRGGSVKLNGQPCRLVRLDLAHLPARNVPDASLVLKIRPESWSIFVERQVVATFPVPMLGAAVMSQPEEEIPAEATERFQKVVPSSLRDDFMVDPEEKNPLGDWSMEKGEWSLHTALEDAIEQKSSTRLTARPLEAERSPNFYSLRGRGEPAIIVTGYAFSDNYRLRAATLVEPGEMGLVFYYQSPESYYDLLLQVPEAAGEYTRVLLRRHGPGDAVTVLGAVETLLTHHQWVQPMVRARGDRLQVYLDQTEMINVSEPLPVFGRFGLTVNSPHWVRFDDVAMETEREMDLDSLAQIQFHTVGQKGIFEPEVPRSVWRSLFGRRDIPEPKRHLTPPLMPDERWLALGSVQHPPQVLSAVFEPQPATATVGLLVGWRGEGEPHWRFTRQWTAGQEHFALWQVGADGQAKLVDELKLPAPEAAASVTLLADALIPGELHLYRNDKLVLIHHWVTPFTGGAAGLYLGANSQSVIRDLHYRFQRDELFRNKYEKNQIYVTDPFMRHWSSPEGEWYHDEAADLMWYKSDFFGRFSLHLPPVSGSVFRLGVPETGAIGELSLALETDKLVLYQGLPADKKVLASGVLPPDGLALTGKPTYTLSVEDQWLWVTSGGKLIFRHFMPQPMAGRRLCATGINYTQLTASAVDRYRVKDFHFTEAPSEWQANGGRWQVINRFQCDPRWSHMNGESKDNLAALWAKYEFGGDFCLEMYAGIRHGWYERCGDINFTVMNDLTSAGRGYTVTCTGWDPDHSQLFTRLYRQGEVVASSDKYLIPRTRAGNRRLKFEDVIVAGQRDVHGAWYYCKLRRIGNKLEYWFDNELVFSYEDKEPLPKGAMGIWTYMNSMMVARVKIAAETLGYRPLAWAPVTDLNAPRRGAPAPLAAAPAAALLAFGQPLQQMTPAAWQVDDEAGQSVVTWHPQPNAAPYAVLRSTLGSGSMALRQTLPPTPLPQLAGWRFWVKRSPKASFDFHFSMGRMSGANYVANRQFVMHLSGTDFDRGPVVLVGRAEVPAQAALSENWHAEGEWTPVTVWLPADTVPGLVSDPTLMVKVEGFGLLQPSFAAQGLTGNYPGEAYAIKDFSPIFYGVPVLSLGPEAAAPSKLTLLDAAGALVASSDTLAELQAALARVAAGLWQGSVRLDYAGRTDDLPLRYLRLSEQVPPMLTWDEQVPSALRLVANGPFQDRRLASAVLTLGGQTLTHRPTGDGSRLALLPRLSPPGDPNLPLTVQVTMGEHVWPVTVPAPLGQGALGPVLLGVTGLTPFLETFERDDFGTRLTPTAQRHVLVPGDPQQGLVLETRNLAYGQRLASQFNAELSLAKYPLLQFRYQAGPMAALSLGIGSHQVALAEEMEAPPAKVRLGTPWQLDETWRSWQGMVADAVTNAGLHAAIFTPGNLRFGSLHKFDQTGMYARWRLDDLVFGPAVRSVADLKVKPAYYDAAGIKTVRVAIAPGALPGYDRTPAELAGLAWVTGPADAELVPTLPAGVADGVHQVILQAINQAGRASTYTSIPFLLDRQAPSVKADQVSTSEPLTNGHILRLTVPSNGGAPLDPATLKVLVGGVEMKTEPRAVRYLHGAEADSIELNWPYLVRAQLDKMTGPGTLTLELQGVQDGAGNQATAPVTVPLVVDYAKDKPGPTMLPSVMPGVILHNLRWEGRDPRPMFFTSVHKGPLEVLGGVTDEPVLQTKPLEGAVNLQYVSEQWRTETYPWLAISMRIKTVPTTPDFKLYLQFVTNHGQTLRLPLNHPATDPDTLEIMAPITWKSGEWTTVVCNLEELLQQRDMDEMILRTLKINRFQIIAAGLPAAGDNFLQVKDFVAFGNWRDTDTVKLAGFDASGLGGANWEYFGGAGQSLAKGQATDLALKPRLLGIKPVADGWLALRLRDKAGNLSAPLRLPYPHQP